MAPSSNTTPTDPPLTAMMVSPVTSCNLCPLNHCEPSLWGYSQSSFCNLHAAPPQNAETIDQSPTQVVPYLGAWSKRLIFQFCPLNTPPEPSMPHNYIWPQLVQSQIKNSWPSLEDSINLKSSSLAAKSSSFEVAASITKGRRFTSISMGCKGEPGFKEFIIPTKVLQLGPENVGEYVIGQFQCCSAPTGGLTHDVVNHTNFSMFHTKRQDSGLFSNVFGILVTLQNIPTSCYSRLGISQIFSGLGEPMLTHKRKNFPKHIALDEKLDNIFLVDVVYSWIPSTCERFGSLGHKAKMCLHKKEKIPLTNEKR
ncbi:hypothetical protein IGI04_025937 [Brassica rapa subsp. trilocularis]|uniref:DUF4283 domain-containing protein n=1 Tax=Brassica rapa subsp. trilocularis TaxID=1813537 RepID=A0ABQ7KX84_BRACM|nr:hypothetical protein IGI04_025937 [Brassica rapa subsp. trilocularis]